DGCGRAAPSFAAARKPDARGCGAAGGTRRRPSKLTARVSRGRPPDRRPAAEPCAINAERIRQQRPPENVVKRTDYCGRIDRRYLDQTVTLMGWVHRRRDHGGVIFVDLRDREGLVQIVFNPDRMSAFPIAESLRNEYVIRVTGV